MTGSSPSAQVCRTNTQRWERHNLRRPATNVQLKFKAQHVHHVQHTTNTFNTSTRSTRSTRSHTQPDATTHALFLSRICY